MSTTEYDFRQVPPDNSDTETEAEEEDIVETESSEEDNEEEVKVREEEEEEEEDVQIVSGDESDAESSTFITMSELPTQKASPPPDESFRFWEEPKDDDDEKEPEKKDLTVDELFAQMMEDAKDPKDGTFGAQAIWGPVFWTTIHLAALGYGRELPKVIEEVEGDKLSEEEKDQVSQMLVKYAEMKELSMIKFFEALPYLLLCGFCTGNLLAHYQEEPFLPHIQGTIGTYKLFEYTVKLHNRVNKSKGKEEWTTEKALRHYLDEYSTYTEKGFAKGAFVYSQQEYIKSLTRRLNQKTAEADDFKEQLELLKSAQRKNERDEAKESADRLAKYLLAGVVVFVLVIVIIFIAWFVRRRRTAEAPEQ